MESRFKGVNLDERLRQCANMVRRGARVVDVGTDHAYLVIDLVKSGKVESALAVDLREGPLKNARESVKKFGCEGAIETRISDGLEAVNGREADDVVIAGMGGELISEIISRAEWLKDHRKRLILQPMTMAEHLRRFLREEKFEIIQEIAVKSAGKVYTVMQVAFTGEEVWTTGIYPYIGKLRSNWNEAAEEYTRKEIKDLSNKIQGCRWRGDLEGANELECVKSELEGLIQGE